VSIPRHVGVIPDGNRRWAKKSALNFLKAYDRASDNLIDIITALFDSGVGYVTFYAFSLKNFDRNDKEKKIVFSLFKKKFEKIEGIVRERGIRVHFAGREELFPDDIREKFAALEKESRPNKKGTLVALVAYDGDDELDYAAAAMKGHGGSLRGNMFVPEDIPPLDLVIRTSGEKRISGFVPYLAGYAELYFSDKLWPDFTKEDLEAALEWYSGRDRRFGK
jgi:undecaprenyl diphosphate synthase